jgi:hypothetical protein
LTDQRLRAIFDGAGVSHGIRVAEGGDPYAVFGIAENGNDVMFTADICDDSLRIMAHQFAKNSLNQGDAGLFNSVNREWAGCAAYEDAAGVWSARMALPLVRPEPDPEALLAYLTYLHTAMPALARFDLPRLALASADPPPSIHQVQSLLSDVGVPTQLPPDGTVLETERSTDNISFRLQAFVPNGSLLVLRARRPERRVREDFAVLGDVARLNACLTGAKVMLWPGAGQLYVEVPVLLAATGLDAEVLGWCMRQVTAALTAVEPIEERGMVDAPPPKVLTPDWTYPWC